MPCNNLGILLWCKGNPMLTSVTYWAGGPWNPIDSKDRPQYRCPPQVSSSIHPYIHEKHPPYISFILAPCSQSQHSWDLPSSQNSPPLLPWSISPLISSNILPMILHSSKNPADAFHFQAPRSFITNPIHSLTDGLVELPILETLLLIQHHRLSAML